MIATRLNINGRNEIGLDHKSHRLQHHVENINMGIAKSLDLDRFIASKVAAFQRLGKQKFKNGVSPEGLQDLFTFLNNLFQNFDIKKLYQITDMSSVGEYSNLSLEEMFLHNIVPFKRTHTEIKSAKGGSCYHWSVFFCKLFESLDIQGQFDVKVISLNPQRGHVACILQYEGRKFIIDVFSKENDVVKEIQEGKQIFSGENRGKKVTQTVFTIDPLSLEDSKGDVFTPEVFSVEEVATLQDLSELRVILQIRTYLKNKKLDLVIERNIDGITIFFNEVGIGENATDNVPLKISFSTHLFLEKVKGLSEGMNSFDIISMLLGYLTEETMEKIKYICEKIDAKELISRIIRAKQAYLSGDQH